MQLVFLGQKMFCFNQGHVFVHQMTLNKIANRLSVTAWFLSPRQWGKGVPHSPDSLQTASMDVMSSGSLCPGRQLIFRTLPNDVWGSRENPCFTPVCSGHCWAESKVREHTQLMNKGGPVKFFSRAIGIRRPPPARANEIRRPPHVVATKMTWPPLPMSNI